MKKRSTCAKFDRCTFCQAGAMKQNNVCARVPLLFPTKMLFLILSFFLLKTKLDNGMQGVQVVAAENPTIIEHGSLSRLLEPNLFSADRKAKITEATSCRTGEDIAYPVQIEEDYIPTLSAPSTNTKTSRAFLARDSLSTLPIVPKLMGNKSSHRNDAIKTQKLGETIDTRSSELQNPMKTSLKKTGTTIAGCVIPRCKGGPWVVLAADTRATEGTLVADKRCDKIHKIASNCRCCGAGTSADLDKITRQVLYHMALEELQGNSIGNGECTNFSKKSAVNSGSSKQIETVEILYQKYGDAGEDDAYSAEDASDEALLWMRPVSIDLVCRIFQDSLFQNGGQLGANLIVGGVWNQKPYLRAIHPHGSADVNLPFAALGSGGLAAMAVLEEGYKPTISIDEGIALVQRAILSGIRNDLGSGSQVDLCVIGPDGSSRQTRGVVPEEVLLKDGRNVIARASEHSLSRSVRRETNGLLGLLDAFDECNTKERNTDIAEGEGLDSGSGVNGFGNQPFAIERTKQRMVSTETDHSKSKETWNNVLGL